MKFREVFSEEEGRGNWGTAWTKQRPSKGSGALEQLWTDVRSAIPFACLLSLLFSSPLFSSSPHFLLSLSLPSTHYSTPLSQPILFSFWLQNTKVGGKDPSFGRNAALWWYSSVSWLVWRSGGDTFQEIISVIVLEWVKENLGKDKILCVMDIGYLTKSLGPLSEPKRGKNCKSKLKEHFPENLWHSEAHKKYHSGAHLTTRRHSSYARTRILINTYIVASSKTKNILKCYLYYCILAEFCKTRAFSTWWILSFLWHLYSKVSQPLHYWTR